MSEIVDDLKISNVEITNELGINLTSDTCRIKHTGNGRLTFSSNGEIDFRTENKTGYDCDINFYAGDGNEDDTYDTEGGDIRLNAGNGSINQYGDGGDIEINAGDGLGNDGGYIEIYSGQGKNEGGYLELRAGNSNVDNVTNSAPAGYVEIYAGDSYGQNADAGYIDIICGDAFSSGTGSQGGNLYCRAGNSSNGSGGSVQINGGDGETNGGDVTIRAGDKDANNGTQGASVYIYGGYSNGESKGGNVEIRAGEGEDGEYGDIKISFNSSEKIGFYGANPIVRPETTGTILGVQQNEGFEIRDDTTFTGNYGDRAYRINDIVRALKQLGLLEPGLIPGLAPAAEAVPQPRTTKTKKEKRDKTQDSE